MTYHDIMTYHELSIEVDAYSMAIYIGIEAGRWLWKILGMGFSG